MKGGAMRSLGRSLLILVVVLLAALAVAVSASATLPQSNVASWEQHYGNMETCGFFLSQTMTGETHSTLYFDKEGAMVRYVFHTTVTGVWTAYSGRSVTQVDHVTGTWDYDEAYTATG